MLVGKVSNNVPQGERGLLYVYESEPKNLILCVYTSGFVGQVSNNVPAPGMKGSFFFLFFFVCVCTKKSNNVGVDQVSNNVPAIRGGGALL